MINIARVGVKVRVGLEKRLLEKYGEKTIIWTTSTDALKLQKGRHFMLLPDNKKIN